MHALDMHTKAKKDFIECFKENILEPRNLDYKLMFCGPTGTNANEAALKIARKYTGRTNVFAFMGAFHGMTLGSLALTSSDFSKVPVENACQKIAKECFATGLVIERAGRQDHVLKIMPALTISDEELMEGMNIIEAAVKKILNVQSCNEILNNIKRSIYF